MTTTREMRAVIHQIRFRIQDVYIELGKLQLDIDKIQKHLLETEDALIAEQEAKV